MNNKEKEIIKKYMSEIGKKGGSVMSEAKAKSAIENGKKGGRKSNAEKNGFELKVTKDGKPRKLKLENDGGKQYHLYIVYPDGQQVRAKIQPGKNGFPDIKFLAEKNGFEF